MTQEGLAERSHLSERAISDLERGLKSPQRATLRLLLEALALPPEEADELARAARPRPARAEAIAGRALNHNLPIPVTSLVGREREVREVRGLLLDSDVRLVTLTGPGGVGKTRVGLAAASEVIHDFAGGVCFVPLARVIDESLVAAAIAEALGVPEVAGKSARQRLEEYIRARALLLVLDDSDRISSGAILVGTLLSACRQLKVLATSRTLLHVYGEHDYNIAPLELPVLQGPASAHDVRRFAATRLFMDRAHAASPDFILSDADAAYLVEICRRLDGLPLAIELAAARIRLFPPRILLTRLDRRLPVLTGGARDLPARHRTMRDTIAWSVEFLSSQEQLVFRRIAVFAGGCRLESAEAVCNPRNDRGIDVLSGLEGLLDHSLVQQCAGADGEPRFTMLETIREYGLELLAASGEELETWHRFSEVYLKLGAIAEAELIGPNQSVWLSRLEDEIDNIRAVLGWSINHGELRIGLELGASIWRFWQRHGYVSEGRAWMEDALNRSEMVEPSVRARAFIAAGELACALGDVRRGLEWSRQSLGLFEALGDLSGRARSLHVLGWVAAAFAEVETDYAAAAAYQEECLALERRLGDRWGEAKALHELGEIARYRDNLASATNLLEEALQLRRKLGDGEGIGWSLHCLAWTEYEGRNYHQARRRAVEALETWNDLRHDAGIASTSSLCARIDWRLGENERGACEVLESLRRWTKLRNRQRLQLDLVVLSGLVEASQPDARGTRRVRRLLGGSNALQDGAALSLHHRTDLDEIRLRMQARLTRQGVEADHLEPRYTDADRVANYATAIAHRLCRRRAVRATT